METQNTDDRPHEVTGHRHGLETSGRVDYQPSATSTSKRLSLPIAPVS